MGLAVGLAMAGGDNGLDIGAAALGGERLQHWIRLDKAQAGNQASDQHYGLIDRVHVYLYRSLQDPVEAVPRIGMNRDAVQARCLELNATAPERSYCVAATDGNGKRDRAEGRARCYNCAGAWGIC